MRNKLLAALIAPALITGVLAQDEWATVDFGQADVDLGSLTSSMPDVTEQDFRDIGAIADGKTKGFLTSMVALFGIDASVSVADAFSSGIDLVGSKKINMGRLKVVKARFVEFLDEAHEPTVIVKTKTKKKKSGTGSSGLADEFDPTNDIWERKLDSGNILKGFIVRMNALADLLEMDHIDAGLNLNGVDNRGDAEDALIELLNRTGQLVVETKGMSDLVDIFNAETASDSTSTKSKKKKKARKDKRPKVVVDTGFKM